MILLVQHNLFSRASLMQLTFSTLLIKAIVTSCSARPQKVEPRWKIQRSKLTAVYQTSRVLTLTHNKRAL